MTKLSPLDMKIIYYLDKNCRQSKVQLARKLRISRTTLSYRIDQLKKRGIIKGTFTEINTQAIGFTSFRILLKLGNTTYQKEQELLAFLRTCKNAFWLSTVIGPWDLDFVFTCKEIYDFQLFYNKLKEEFNSIIASEQIGILEEITQFSKDYIINEKRNDFTIQKIKHVTTQQLDTLSLRILSLLASHADMSILEIADRTHSTINTVKKKIHFLQKERIILGFRLFIDTNELGYEYYKWHISLKDYNKDELTRLKEYLASFSFVTYFNKYTGNDDLEIEIHLKNKDELITFKTSVKMKFGHILKSEYHLQFPKELLFRYLPTLQ